ncbi:pyocin knob domain-containing protein [Pectobacterium brasiliense]|uniref:pyocin knob domain-containing protein n=1 Tax=Pectobacterium brasiliense TaxID=180957 RepID=UPI00227B919E|nr:phage tail protein [Pectobacterium brasiliense]WGL26474.1 phage tail protein [Pectobacterium brasiliense]WJM81952.1 phage tail protein [Pectobacterium brasiliense]
MANLSENPQWVDGIYQIETSDPVVGGPDGVSNRQAKELASRTSYLKKEQEKTGSDLAKHTAAADPHTQYAPKENPTFTGTPKAPTPATDSNSQQIATTAFVRSVGSTKLAKDQNGADIQDRELFNRNLGSSRAYSSSIPIGGSAGLWTTAEFIGWLESQGAFVHAYWVCRGSWSYVHNKIISDTECGQIPLAGSVVEVMGQNDATTIRITTPSTTPAGFSDSANAQFTYVYNGIDYSPGWRRDYNTKNKPTAADVGALPVNAVAQAAAKFATPRTINGVPFDGSANIALTPANIGALPASGTAVSAAKLAVARKIAGVAFDGTADININSQGIFSASLSIGNAVDLNAYTTPGLYHQAANVQAASGKNYPEAQAGSLEVLKHAGITQVYRIYNNSRCYKRTQYSGVWSAWVLDYDTENKPTAADIGAMAKTDADNNYVRQGSSGVVYKNDDLAWNSPTGAYLKDNGTHSSLIWHMGLNTGSASAAQFYFDFANGGVKYRSSRDNSGFEKPWARIYSDQDKPTAAEIGAYTKAETDAHVAAAIKIANNAATEAVSANTNANERVPSVRKVNGKVLTSDITLTADDVGAMPANSPGVKIWVSGEYTPATSTPIVVSHGLANINPLRCRCDVLVKCIAAEGEYRVGDFAINPMTLFMQQGVAHPYSLLPALNTSTVQLNMMHYLAASFKTSTIGNQQLNMANWRFILRIFY